MRILNDAIHHQKTSVHNYLAAMSPFFPEDNPQRHGIKTEGLSQLIHQEAFIGKMNALTGHY